MLAAGSCVCGVVGSGTPLCLPYQIRTWDADSRRGDQRSARAAMIPAAIERPYAVPLQFSRWRFTKALAIESCDGGSETNSHGR